MRQFLSPFCSFFSGNNVLSLYFILCCRYIAVKQTHVKVWRHPGNSWGAVSLNREFFLPWVFVALKPGFFPQKHTTVSRVFLKGGKAAQINLRIKFSLAFLRRRRGIVVASEMVAFRDCCGCSWRHHLSISLSFFFLFCFSWFLDYSQIRRNKIPTPPPPKKRGTFSV